MTSGVVVASGVAAMPGFPVSFIRQHADRAAFANDTTSYPVFDSVTNGALTLPVGTYAIDALIQCKVMSATSGNMKWSLLGTGTATLANVLQLISGIDGAMNTTAAVGCVPLITEASTVNVVSAATSVNCTIVVTGTFELTVAGTIIPSLAQSTAVATAVITAGSYLRITQLGAPTTVSLGTWS